MPAVEKFYADHREDCEEVKVGDIVRSYDFEFHDDCFILGKVVRTTEPMEGCERYEIMCLRRIFDGKESVNRERYYYPPINGTRNILGGFTNCVRKVDEETAEFWNYKIEDWSSDNDPS